MDVKNLGQVFTPQSVVSDILALIKNEGRILEPSCGDGAFSKNLPGCVSIELDGTKAPKVAIVMDFFDYSSSEKFDTIIGNPPYVRFQDILPSTKEKLDMDLFDERSNLYLFFIYKSVLHLNVNGELIFIVPRDFLKATSSIKLNKFLYENGTITDIIDLGDKIIFKDACPNTVIFRYEKGNFSRKTNISQTFKVINGQILFTTNNYSIPFSDLFFVKVGGVSGADKYFENKNGNKSFVCSTTRKDGKTKKMFYNKYSEYLLPYKNELMGRKIKSFNDENWYEWGRKYYDSQNGRIYVNVKTRQEHPFFFHSCRAYDGSVLAIFPKFHTDKFILKQLAKDLNDVNWFELGFICDGRFIFSQKSLENAVLPEVFKKYYMYLKKKQ